MIKVYVYSWFTYIPTKFPFSLSICTLLCLVSRPCLTLCDPMNYSPPGSPVRDSPSKNTGAGCHVLHQGIYPTQDSNPGLPHCSWVLYHLSYCVCTKSLQLCLTLCDPVGCGPPGFSVCGILQATSLEWVAMASSSGSSQPRDLTHVSLCLLHWQMGSLSLVPPWKSQPYRSKKKNQL